jgi:hypothetical protein
MRSPALLNIVGGLALISGTLAFGQPDGAPSGSITGTVLNEASEFVAGARVFAIPTDGRAVHHPKSAETDKDGHFTIAHLDWGTYRLFGAKEEDGYPNTYMSFYDNQTISQCTLAQEAPTATAIVSIGPKAGIITGTVSDATTGTPIRNATIRLWPWNYKERPLQMSAGSPYRAIIPSNQPVGMEVNAPGYETWRHLGTGTQPETIPFQLKSGESLTVNIALQPTTK